MLTTWVSAGPHDWGLIAQATPTREIAYPRGKVTGGGSAVNGHIALRGTPGDFDEWAAWGNHEWSFEKVLPFHRKLEDDRDARGDFHGVGGPIWIERTRRELAAAQSRLFRIESKVFPQLQEKGSNGLYYTQKQIAEVIEYARDRGIRVVPEFDMPCHTTSWFVGYPQLASGPGPYQIQTRWGIFDYAMDPTRESTFEFLDRFLGEMTAMFPDAYFHIGGDECNGKEWDANPRIQAYMKEHGLKDDAALQSTFTERVQKLVVAHHKIPEGWDEILQPDTARDVVIQSWSGQKGLATAVRQGNRALLSNGYYIDLNQSAAYHYSNDPLGGDGASLTAEEKARVLGGEATMWSEFVTPENIDSRIWPRTAAIAERLWSPQERAGCGLDVSAPRSCFAASSSTTA